MDDDNDEMMDYVNPLYERHEGLGINQDQRVAIIGCGGIGSWIALYLGLAGVRYIDIYDSDIISENNLNRFPLGPDKIGINKAIAMTEHIQYLRSDVNVTPRQNFDPDIHFDKLSRYRWVIVTTDSLKSRRMVYENVVKAGKDRGAFLGYIEAGADGHHATVTFSPATFSTPDEDNPGYRTVPVFVGPCAMAAAIVAYYILMGDVRDYQRTVDINWGVNGRESPLVTSDRVMITEIDEADHHEIVDEDDNPFDDHDDHDIGDPVIDEQLLVEDQEADNEQTI